MYRPLDASLVYGAGVESKGTRRFFHVVREYRGPGSHRRVGPARVRSVDLLGLTHEPNRQTEVEAYARYISTISYLTQHILGSVFGTILAIFGVISLAAYLANGRTGRLALVAMVMSVAGNCLVLAIFGFSTIVSPVIVELYLAGQRVATKVNEAIFGSTAFAFLAVSGLLLYLVGAILFGVAIWRSGTLPRWGGVLYAPTGFLIAAGVEIGVAQTLGSALLAVAGTWIAWSVMRGPSSQQGVHPRVRRSNFTQPSSR